MRISARNVLKGTVTRIEKGATTGHVTIDIAGPGGNGTLVTASITNASIDELGLAEGKPAYAVVKASNVMVAVD